MERQNSGLEGSYAQEMKKKLLNVDTQMDGLKIKSLVNVFYYNVPMIGILQLKVQ